MFGESSLSLRRASFAILTALCIGWGVQFSKEEPQVSQLSKPGSWSVRLPRVGAQQGASSGFQHSQVPVASSGASSLFLPHQNITTRGNTVSTVVTIRKTLLEIIVIGEQEQAPLPTGKRKACSSAAELGSVGRERSRSRVGAFLLNCPKRILARGRVNSHTPVGVERRT